ncbi:MAG: CopD family protein [Chloroflexota bacterium]
MRAWIDGFRQRPLWLLIALTMLITILLAVNQSPAKAHGFLIRSIPASGAVLDRAPSRIQAWFTEGLEPKFSTLGLTNEKGETIPLDQDGVSPTNPSQLAARLPAGLPDGSYIVTLRVAFADDGHVVTETFPFWIGTRSGNIAAIGPTSTALPLEVVWRIFTLTALNILFGTTLLYQFVLLPGWGNRQYRAGKLPPRVMLRLNILVAAMLFLAAIGSVLALLQQASVLFAADLSTVISNGLWSIVLNSTQFGSVLSIRVGLIVLTGVVEAGTIYLSERQPEFVTLLWAVNTVVTGFLLGTLSAGSHATGSTLWPIAATGVDWLHLLANSAWVGGLVALAATLPVALHSLVGGERRTALMAVLRRFSALATAALALLIVTGIFSALLQIRQPSDLPGTNYGLTLLAKIALIVPLLFIALYHHLVTAPGRFSALAVRLRLVERFENLMGSITLEAGLGIGVIALTALLTATPPPIPPEAQNKLEPPSQQVAVDDIQVKLSVDPGAVGSNTYQVSLSRAGKAVVGTQVKLQFVYPALDKRSGLLPLDDTGDGTYLAAGDDLERSGQWEALVDVSDGTAPIRAAFHWDVPDVAPTTTSRQPQPINWLSAVSIVLVGAMLLVPGTLHTARSLNLQRESVMIGLAATIGTIVMLLLGAWLLADAGQRSDALRNPIPAVVNPVLADAVSVTAGRTLYEAKCLECHGANGAGDGIQAAKSAPPDLRDKLPVRRDEELYSALNPHKNLATLLQLSDQDRWNVINYLRSAVFAPVNQAR